MLSLIYGSATLCSMQAPENQHRYTLQLLIDTSQSQNSDAPKKGEVAILIETLTDKHADSIYEKHISYITHINKRKKVSYTRQTGSDGSCYPPIEFSIGSCPQEDVHLKKIIVDAANFVTAVKEGKRQTTAYNNETQTFHFNEADLY